MDKQTIGTKEEGFSIGPAAAVGTIEVRMWGFWTEQTAEKFAATVISTCASASGSILTIGAKDLKPLRDSGQQAVGAVFAALPAYKVKRIRITEVGALTRLQLLRIVKERAAPGLVEFETQ